MRCFLACLGALLAPHVAADGAVPLTPSSADPNWQPAAPRYEKGVGHIHDVPADGDCLFMSIALAMALAKDGKRPKLSALRATAYELRTQAVSLMCPGGEPDPELRLGGLSVYEVAGWPENLVPEAVPVHCKKMARRGTWAHTAEILALQKVLDAEIHAYTDFGKKGKTRFRYGVIWQGHPDYPVLRVRPPNIHIHHEAHGHPDDELRFRAVVPEPPPDPTDEEEDGHDDDPEPISGCAVPLTVHEVDPNKGFPYKDYPD